jgi:hypothetical protein
MKYSENYRKSSQDIDLDFIKWIDQVEQIVKTHTGYNLLELPDLPYMIRFEDETSAEEMADEVFSEIYEL